MAAAVGLWGTLSLSVLSAQQVQAVRETIDVSVVNVDVIVTDRDGNPARGLKAGDFEIRENGRLQQITHFVEYAPGVAGERVGVGSPVIANPSPRRALVPEPRTIVIFLESFGLPAFRTGPMFAALREMVRKSVRPGDSVAVYTWESGRTYLRHHFTDDVARVEEVLSNIEEENTGVAGNVFANRQREMAFEHAFYDRMAEAGPAGAWASAQKRAASDAVRFAEAADGHVELWKIHRKAQAIESLMQAVSAVPGRKVLLMATERFGVYAGAHMFHEGVVPLAKRPDLDTRSIRESLIRKANAYGVTIYTLHPAGLEWSPRSDAMEVRADVMKIDREGDAVRSARDNNILLNETSALAEIAAATGGRLAWGHKDVVALLPRVGEDLDSYYSLAYRASEHRDVRKLSVTVRGNGYRVRTRRQVVEQSDAAKMEDRVISSLYRDLGAGSIPIEVELGTITEAEPRRFDVPVTVRIPVSSLLTSDGRGSFTVLVAAGGDLGVVSDVRRRTEEFTVAAGDEERARQSHFTYEFTLRLDAASYQISVGVMDEVSRDWGLKSLDLLASGSE